MNKVKTSQTSFLSIKDIQFSNYPHLIIFINSTVMITEFFYPVIQINNYLGFFENYSKLITMYQY